MKKLLIVLLIFLLFVSHCKTIKNDYTYYELKGLPEEKLYKVFIENGLEVDAELEESLTEDEIAKMLKVDFDLHRKCKGCMNCYKKIEIKVKEG